MILHDLIYSTASDKRLVPTSQHLKKLLQALESRLSISGFTESALGWALIFSNQMSGSPEAKDRDKAENKLNYTMTPPNNVVCELTKGISQLARVGEQLQKIEIVTTSEHAAWLVAFINWCLGKPPAIILEGNRALAPETDNVIVRLAKRGTELRINTFDCIGNIKNLVATDKLSMVSFSGMVDVRTFGLATLNRHFGHPDEPKYHACLQALPHACKLIRRRIEVFGDIISDHWRYDEVPNPEGWRSPSTKLLKGEAFPPLRQMSQALHNYTSNSGEKAPLSLQELPDIEHLVHLPSVSLVRKTIKSTCPCFECQHTSDSSATFKCEYTQFIEQICECVAHVMAISLLHPSDPKGVQVCFGSEVPEKTIRNMFMTLQQLPVGMSLHLSEILGFVIPVLGHQPPQMATWIMSSWYGQTVLPCILSNETLQKEEILALECIPGAIIRGEEYFNNIMVSPVCEDGEFEKAHKNTEDDDHPLLEQRTLIKDAIVPKDLFKGFQLQWMVEIRDTAILTSLTMPQLHGMPIRNPRRIWDAALNSVFVDCSHDPATPFHPQSLKIWNLQPVDPRRRRRDHPDVGVVQSYQNEPVRYFTLTSGRPAIVRMQACLNCCIDRSELVSDVYVIV